MRVNIRNDIPDRSWPGLTTAAFSAAQQGANGNYATANDRNGRRQTKRGGRRARRQRERKKALNLDIRIGSLNVGTMTGKGRELVDMMERRKIDILGVQETKWKGSKSRNLGGGYKLIYNGEDRRRNGVGIIVKEECISDIHEVKRVSDRIISVKVDIRGVIVNVISAYAPQVGCEGNEKEEFWTDMDELVRGLPVEERIVIAADLNGHVGERNAGDEKVMGSFGVGNRNHEGQMVVDFAKGTDMALVNTFYKKKEEHRITYKSGGRSSQIDYILYRRNKLKEMTDCKVIAGESVATQHRVLVCRMTLKVRRTKMGARRERKIRWWKLKDRDCRNRFSDMVKQRIDTERV